MPLESSLLQRHRSDYRPRLPESLNDLQILVPVPYPADSSSILESEIPALFPLTSSERPVSFAPGNPDMQVEPLRAGIVFSGGPAPGGHNVVSGLFDALKKLHPGSELVGFLNGPQGIIENRSVNLTLEIIAPYRNRGGFDLLGSGRTKIETPEQFEAVERTLLALNLDGLVIVGGDDSNTNAAFLSEYCLKRSLKTRIVGVPKTIDGDLQNPFVELPFGFDTASKIYSEIIGNICCDCLAAKKYYFFVKLMGRSASHITLECALQTRPNLALIGEEVGLNNETLPSIAEHIANLICRRAASDKHYGVILIPEGLPEFTSHPEKLRAEFVERDDHGNILLSGIETERLLIDLVQEELDKRKESGAYEGRFSPIPLFFGYEGRSGMPTNFDADYCYSLGHVAALLIRHRLTGYMACIRYLSQPPETREPFGIPIAGMLRTEERSGTKKAVVRKTLVDLEGAAFRSFSASRDSWRIHDCYRSPGPIQFEGPSELTDRPPLTLIYASENPGLADLKNNAMQK